ncbi:uncharacterized protein LOC116656420 [Drosophila ananassae]|uniref:uncharacterized protein LOC116656419 n=1 Tax=Drosophila ananassae TaxID=7217 RepID=UPI0013A5F282|nr:uncharacterized protein LOC116656419 [Drosophila ananassae]XP_032311879.1 uncharacterized protein LOC116656420 [Drosophila ananassae]
MFAPITRNCGRKVGHGKPQRAPLGGEVKESVTLSEFGMLKDMLIADRTPRSADESRCKILLIMPLGGPIRSTKFANGFGIWRHVPIPERTPRSADESRCKILLIMPLGGSIRSTEFPNGFGHV